MGILQNDSQKKWQDLVAKGYNDYYYPVHSFLINLCIHVHLTKQSLILYALTACILYNFAFIYTCLSPFSCLPTSCAEMVGPSTLTGLGYTRQLVIAQLDCLWYFKGIIYCYKVQHKWPHTVTENVFGNTLESLHSRYSSLHSKTSIGIHANTSSAWPSFAAIE